MEAKVTPYFVELTYHAALCSFWRREALRKFLRDCHVTEIHLATWSDGESKRDFLDRTFAALQRNSRGHLVIAEMARSLAEKTTFPDLRNWEDSAQKIKLATQAVSELKLFLAKQAENARSLAEKEAVKAKAKEERNAVQKKLTLNRPEFCR